MRRATPLFLAALALATLAGSTSVLAQDTPANRQEQSSRDEQARQRRLDREFQRDQLPIPELQNAGPCPFVKVLYDAARTIEFEGGQRAASAVAWSGEIEGLSATCRYKEGEPIVVEIITTFAVGRGPRATGMDKTLPYWVAVTDRDHAILGKESFTVQARIPRGEDRVVVYDHIQRIVIPRADSGVSGSNFEVLVGFEVTPEMAEFNRQGSRFQVTATAEQAAAETPAAAANNNGRRRR